MKKAVALVFCTAGVSGCLTSNVLVTVRPDGSGTETTIVRTSAMARFQTLVSPELAAKLSDPAAISRELQKIGAATLLGRNLRVRSTRPLNTADTLAWTPDGTLLMAVNSTVYRCRLGELDWTVVANLEALGLRELSRLAVSPKGDRLAIVAHAK